MHVACAMSGVQRIFQRRTTNLLEVLVTVLGIERIEEKVVLSDIGNRFGAPLAESRRLLLRRTGSLPVRTLDSDILGTLTKAQRQELLQSDLFH